jgi:hypothetical protein
VHRRPPLLVFKDPEITNNTWRYCGTRRDICTVTKKSPPGMLTRDLSWCTKTPVSMWSALINTRCKVLDHHPYSWDLSPCDLQSYLQRELTGVNGIPVSTPMGTTLKHLFLSLSQSKTGFIGTSHAHLQTKLVFHVVYKLFAVELLLSKSIWTNLSVLWSWVHTGGTETTIIFTRYVLVYVQQFRI